MKEGHKNKVDQCDVVSFDVFDTLLARKTVHPRDVFIVARELFNERSKYLCMDDLYENRFKAEEYARASQPKKIDITIDDIYIAYGELYGYDEKYCDELKKYELQAEQMMLTRDKSTFEIYEYAKSQKKKIIIISDMYLLKSQISALLKSNGVDVWDDMIVSSEDEVAKFSGSAFAEIVRRYPEAKVVHVGDNIVSDISWSQKFGFEAIHIHANVEELSFEIHPSHRAIYGGDRFRWSLLKEKVTPEDVQFNILSGLTAQYCIDPLVSPERAVGYGFFGPLLLSYVQWLDRESRGSGVDHIYFLARDGAIMKDAYNAYFGSDALPNTYMLGSRRLLNFPSFHKDNFSTNGIDGIVGTKELSIENTLRYYHIDPTEEYVKSVLNRVGLEGVESVTFGETADRFKAALLILEPEFRAQSEKESRDVLEYFDQLGLLSNRKPVLCDVGWNGSMQIAIELLTNKALKGLYFGLYNTKKSNTLGSRIDGYFDARSADDFDLHYEKVFQEGGILIIESLFTNPNQSSLIGLKRNKDGSFEGIEGDYDNDEDERNKVREIHAAALQFIADFKSLDLPKSLKIIRREVALRPIDWMVANPSDVIASMFGKVKFSDVASSVPAYIGHPKHDKKYYEQNKGLLKDEYEKAFWKSGFAKNCEILGIPLDR